MNFIEKQVNRSISRKLIIYVLGVVFIMNVIMLFLIGSQSARNANTFAANYSISLSEV